eukprot:scaffold48029_cov69-Phaeocystis_antarctica.AAC.3
MALLTMAGGSRTVAGRRRRRVCCGRTGGVLHYRESYRPTPPYHATPLTMLHPLSRYTPFPCCTRHALSAPPPRAAAPEAGELQAAQGAAGRWGPQP